MQIYSTNARFYSKNTLFRPLKCVFYKQTDSRLPSSSMNTILHCSIPGRLLITKGEYTL